jgi:hypothetical protein
MASKVMEKGKVLGVFLNCFIKFGNRKCRNFLRKFIFNSGNAKNEKKALLIR